MAARVLIHGQDAVSFDVYVEAVDAEGTYVVRGAELDAFKRYVHAEGAARRFDVSCDLGVLRECKLTGEGQAQSAVFCCSNFEPPAPSG